jgi:CRISPR-associated protein Cmr2
MINFQRKLYALLQISSNPQASANFLSRLDCFRTSHETLKIWWHEHGGNLSDQIASTSDRVNLKSSAAFIHNQSIEDYQESSIDDRVTRINQIWSELRAQPDLSEEEALKRLFCWCWRFYPRLSNIPLLTPSHDLLPDNPIHSYNSAVSALTGALFPGQRDETEQPCLTDKSIEE